MTPRNLTPADDTKYATSLKTAGWIRMASRFPGRCTKCGDKFDTGAVIAWNKATSKTMHYNICALDFIDGGTATASPPPPAPSVSVSIGGKKAKAKEEQPQLPLKVELKKKEEPKAEPKKDEETPKQPAKKGFSFVKIGKGGR